MAIGLGIDAGGTATRWLLLEDSKEIARGELESITGHVYTPEDQRRNVSRLEQLCKHVLKISVPDAVVGGFTGLHVNTEGSRVFSEILAKHFKLPLQKIHLDNDMHIAYACAFEPGQGVLIYAGTGSVGYFEDADKNIIRSGGSGYLLDDFGAAFWIGQQGIQHVMRTFDETGKPSESILAKEIYATIDSNIWDDIMKFIYSGEARGILAKLAPAVTRAAEQQDTTAIKILEHAGKELGRLAKVILKRLDKSLPVAFMGGMSQASPILDIALQEALPKGTVFSKVTTEPVLAAAKLALKKVN